jgi:signal transduction histidine kinase
VSSPSVPAAEWPEATIVVVDDEPLICRVMAQVLASRGYRQVHTFEDPTEALARFDDLAPDLVLLDLNMPQMHGTQVLERIVTRPEGDRVPVIIMTGAGRPEDAHRTLAMGAADFLRKPVDTTELLLRVRYQLREIQLRRALADHADHLGELVDARAGELALLSRVLDEMPLPAMVLTEDLDLHYANTRGREILAATEGGLLGVLAVNDARREEIADAVQSVGRTPRRLPVVIRTREGTAHRAELQAQRVEGGLISIVLHDLEDQELAKDALNRALEHERELVERMRALEALRTNFLTAVSHELRTPLTVVLGIAELLRRRDGAVPHDQQQDLLERLEDNADRLRRLLDDLLDLNRLSEGRRAVSFEPVDLADLVAVVVEEVSPLEDHPLDVLLEPCLVEAEPTTLRRVVSNLIRNAAVHTPPGTPIAVHLEVAGDRARCRVVDQGVGVPDDAKERIFERFEQGGSAPRHRPGTGIGLTLVRGFVDLHGGRVWVEDTPGGGATFVVELPRSQAVDGGHGDDDVG